METKSHKVIAFKIEKSKFQKILDLVFLSGSLA
jgi:hypothetical protein